MVICGNTDDRQVYLRRIEKVKFGAPVEEAFNHDIPATLLVLLLKLNKEGVVKKDIWRAPGNQAQVRKLIHIMQHGRLVNLANFSVYTAASVIKKFLSKLPGGIFGSENERRLFECVEIAEPERRREAICRVVQSLSVPSQHLLVLLFGTFRMISDGSITYNTKMSPESIGISVAPSLFHTCIHDGHRAHIEDVIRFRVASQIVSFIISNFGCTNLFPRENYEYYARITGRTLHIDENWTFSFRSDYLFHPSHEQLHDDTDGDKTWMSEETNECNLRLTEAADAAHSRLNSSLDEVMAGEMRRNELIDSSMSLSFLGEVHDRQTKRMKTRSDWFLSKGLPSKLLEFKSLEAALNQPTSTVTPPSRSSETKPPGRGSARRRSWRCHYVRPKTLDS